jgi:hypothetical protein
MGQTNYYAGLIWTNHVLERMMERGIKQEMASETFHHPDKSFKGRESGSMEYQKRFGHSRVTVIARQNDQREWIILSAWIDPPLAGTPDARKKNAYRAYQRAGFWGKFWRIALRQLGITNF